MGEKCVTEDGGGGGDWVLLDRETGRVHGWSVG